MSSDDFKQQLSHAQGDRNQLLGHVCSALIQRGLVIGLKTFSMHGSISPREHNDVISLVNVHQLSGFNRKGSIKTHIWAHCRVRVNDILL